jgi:flagellar basal-body rod modification protein FlgD
LPQQRSAAKTSAADAAANKATLDYDTFLTLLVEQMKNQDPTEPMDSTEQIAQLATFSQVEQTIQTNKNLEEPAPVLQPQSGRVA